MRETHQGLRPLNRTLHWEAKFYKIFDRSTPLTEFSCDHVKAAPAEELLDVEFWPPQGRQRGPRRWGGSQAKNKKRKKCEQMENEI